MKPKQFNRNRSIAPTIYNREKKIRGFNNIPSNQEKLIIGIKIVNEESYFTHFNAGLNGGTYKPDFIRVGENGLLDEMKKNGL